jgi:predicted SAM-dependent methyltransferase
VKLNLGCGSDVKDGYLNVDFRDLPGTVKVDLSKMPWPWKDGEVEEILMLDFLEHFPYRKTEALLNESWRILKEGCPLVVQVPSFEECAAAMLYDEGMLCNACGFEWTTAHFMGNEGRACGNCKQPIHSVAEAGMRRLYGGQDYEGNWHHAAFTRNSIQKKLYDSGFRDMEFLEEEHQRKNWNMKVRALKGGDLWGDQ